LAEPLLRLWLGASFGHLSGLVVLMTIHLCINLAMYPLYSLPLATNRLKVPGLVTLGLGLVNLALALTFTVVCKWGLYGIAAAGAITLTLRHLLFTPLYSAHLLNKPWLTFYRGVPVFVLATLSTAAVGRLLLWIRPVSNWLGLILTAMMVSLTFGVVLFLLLSPAERLGIAQMIRGRGERRPETLEPLK
jgi:membrane protein EpsK